MNRNSRQSLTESIPIGTRSESVSIAGKLFGAVSLTMSVSDVPSSTTCLNPHPPMISNQKYWSEVIQKKLTPRVIRLIAVPIILCAGYVTNALPLAIGVSLFVTILALTRP